MDKLELEQALYELDAQLESGADLIVVGGAAMILWYGALRATRDVDVIPLRGDLGALRAAVAKVAVAHDWPDNWVSDAAKGFADILTDDFYTRLTVLPLKTHRLRLYVLGRADLAALKIVALREQDLEDLDLLLGDLQQADRALLIRTADHVARFRPDWAQRILYFLEERR